MTQAVSRRSWGELIMGLRRRHGRRVVLGTRQSDLEWYARKRILEGMDRAVEKYCYVEDVHCSWLGRCDEGARRNPGRVSAITERMADMLRKYVD